MIRIFFFIAFGLCVYLDAHITLHQLNDKPKSIAKDFMIWQYLQQKITPRNAQLAFDQSDFFNRKLLLAYSKRSGSKKLHFITYCMTLSKTKLLQTSNMQCLDIALSPYKATFFKASRLLFIAKNIDDNDTANYLSFMGHGALADTLLKYPADTVLKVFNQSGSKYRNKHFNHQYSINVLDKLMESSKFATFIKIAVTDYKLNNLHHALLYLDADKLSPQSNFYLSLNALRLHKPKKAKQYLSMAYMKATSPRMQDKILFWEYLVSGNKSYLHFLSASTTINLYTLYAKEFLHVKINNYFTQVYTKPAIRNTNIDNPFVWRKIRQQIYSTSYDKLFSLAKEYQAKNLQSVQAFIISRAYRYKIHNFITPYQDMIDNLSLKHQAFIYAIMRQESRFIPSAISTSYALGLMQLMPFVVDNLAHQLHFNITSYNELFKPKVNLLFAKKYLFWLQRHVKNPLFQAYAYNGGYGFLRHYLSSDRFTNGKYEPFLSMEMMANSQTRGYGKRVLTNYIMYQNIMGHHASIVKFLNTLKDRKES